MLHTEYKVIRFFQLDRKRDIDGTGIKNAKFSDHPHVASFTQEGYLFTFLNSKRHEARSHTLGDLQCVFITGWLPLIGVKILLPQERIRRILSHVPLDEINDCNSFCHNIFVLGL